MRTYTFAQSAKGGIADYDNVGVAGAFKAGSQALDIRKTRDTISCQQAIAQMTTADNGGVFSGMVIKYVDASDGNTYAFTDDGKIFVRSGNTWVLKYTDSDGAITGAEQWYKNDGTTYLTWANDTKLKKKPLPGASDWSDVTTLSSGLTGSVLHTMAVADGALQICNGSNIAMLGYDGSLTLAALDLIPGNTAKTVLERLGNVAIGTIKATNAELGALFEWESDALTYTKKKEIPAKGVNAIVDTEVTLMQAGTNGGVFFTDFVNILPLINFPGGGQCKPGAVDNYKGMALFGMYGGSTIDGLITTGIYSYGRIRKNASFVPNFDYPIDADTIGAIKVSGSDILVSYKKGSTNYFAKVDTANKANAIFRTIDLVVPPELPDETTIWGAVEVETLDMPASTAIELWYRMNKNGNFVQAQMEDAVLQHTAGTRAVFQVMAEGKIAEFMLKLFPSGNNTPEVTRAIAYLGTEGE